MKVSKCKTFKKAIHIMICLCMILFTLSFNVFAEGEVAKIGDTLYPTLTEAITAANAMEGDVTITLLSDITFNEMYTIINNITIEGAYTLTRDDAYTGGLFIVNAGKTLTLNDLTIDSGNEWTFHEDTYNQDIDVSNPLKAIANYYTPEDGAPVATKALISMYGEVILNNATVKNYVGNTEAAFKGFDNSSLTLNGATITKCLNTKNGETAAIFTTGNVIVNEGTVISENLGSGNATTINVRYGNNSTLTINGGEIKNNYGCGSGVGVIMITEGTMIMNGGLLSGNKHPGGVVYLHDNSLMTMYDGVITENQSHAKNIVYAYRASALAKVYGGFIGDNTTYNGSFDIRKGYGTVELYGGEFTNYATELNSDGYGYCAPGYTIAGVDRDGDGENELYKVIKLVNIEYEDVTPAGTEGEKLYNIIIATPNDDADTERDIINRLNSVDLTFEFDKENDVSYEIIRSNPEIEINPVDNSTTRYEFHYNGKDDVTTDTANKINLGQVKFTGYGKFTFSVDESVDTNVAHATTLTDNIVESYAAVNGIDLSIVAGENYLNIENVIEDVINLPLRNLAINITFPNNVEFNSNDYQKMAVKVTGGLVDHTFNLGDTSKTETPDDDTDDIVFGPEKSDYTLTKGTVTIPLEAVGGTSEIVTVNAYTLNLKLPFNTTYTVEISGDGYRTARYGVALPEDKVLNFWNNVMDTERVIEEGRESSKVLHNFLAGDIVEDNDINIYDLSAVVSYFAKSITDPAEYDAYVKYDLNRDGVIDSKDVAYVLVSWGN